MKKCKKCKNKNLKEALFCENCGAPIKNKRYLPLILGVAAVCAIFIIGIFVSTKFFSPYDRYVDMGYKLMDKGDIQGAVEAFDEAIKLNAKRTKAFVGKIKAYSKTDGENTAENISDTAKEGYEKTESEEIVDAVEEVEKELLGAGRGAVAYEMLKNLEGIKGFERFEESIKGTEEKIISKYKELLKKFDDSSSYSIYDIDKNGIPEIIMTGYKYDSVCDVVVYSIENNGVVEVGGIYDIDSPWWNFLTVPDKNGLLMVYEYPEMAEMITLMEGTLKYESASNEEGMIILDGQETGAKIDEIYCEFNCDEIIKDSKWLNSFSIDETLYLDTYFKKYDSMKGAAKDIISLAGETYTYYAICDVEQDGHKEMILIRNEDYNTGLYYETAMYGKVMGLLDKKIDLWFGVGGVVEFYECEGKGIACKEIDSEYRSYYSNPKGDFGFFKKINTDELSYIHLKEIPIYPIDDLSAIEALD